MQLRRYWTICEILSRILLRSIRATRCARRRADTSNSVQRRRRMASNKQTIGWIGMGRMGYPMAERLLKAGYDLSIWNRTRAKAEPLVAKGGKVVDKLTDLAGMDVVFSIVSTGKDLEEIYFGKDGVASQGRMPKVLVDCSTIAVEESAAIRARLGKLGSDFVASPVSGHAKGIRAGKVLA